MEAKAAARIFHDWAAGEGLMAVPVAKSESTAQQLHLVQPVTDKGKQLLRTKQIHAIGFDTSDNKLVVFTRQAAPSSKKALALLPDHVDDVTVQYRQGKTAAIGIEPTTPFGAPPYTVRVSPNGTVYTCGSSISAGNARDAGTMGCLLRNGTGEVFGLSNNHVSGSCSFAGVGLPILAPGVIDVAPNGLNPFTIGLHHSSLPLVTGDPGNVDHKANRDSAIFGIVDPGRVSSYQGDAYDTPSTVGAIAAGMIVEKYGRTTGLTKGTVVSEIYGAHPIQYAAPQYGFSGIVCFEPVFAIVGENTIFSDNGDSGSLITTVDPTTGLRSAVGIVVGGMHDGSAPGKRTTIALAIEPVLSGFGLTLVTGHNV